MVATSRIAAQPVYALRQANGTAWLLVGAFESLEQASLYSSNHFGHRESRRCSCIVKGESF